MTYGFVPGNWPAFQRQLEARGLTVDDIEKVEIRPSDDARQASMIDVVVTARSGAVHVWRQDEAPPPA